MKRGQDIIFLVLLIIGIIGLAGCAEESPVMIRNMGCSIDSDCIEFECTGKSKCSEYTQMCFCEKGEEVPLEEEIVPPETVKGWVIQERPTWDVKKEGGVHSGLYAISIISDKAYIAGSGSFLGIFDGSKWIQQPNLYPKAGMPYKTALNTEDLVVLSENQMFAATDAGIFSFDGTEWKEEEGKEEDFFRFVPNQLFAVGNKVYAAGMISDNPNSRGAIAMFEGTDWEVIYEGPAGRDLFFRSLYMVSENEGYVGAKGSICKYDGTSCNAMPADNFDKYYIYDIKFLDPQNGYAIGTTSTEGVLLHYDGEKWKRIPSGMDKHISALYPVSKTEVYIGGSDLEDNSTGSLFKYDGVSIDRIELPQNLESKTRVKQSINDIAMFKGKIMLAADQGILILQE